jgi:hypothetical protein
MTTWLERLQTDESLQAFVRAEIARAGIELDTLKYQRDHLRRNVETLQAQLDAAHAELRTLRPAGCARTTTTLFDEVRDGD